MDENIIEPQKQPEAAPVQTQPQPKPVIEVVPEAQARSAEQKPKFQLFKEKEQGEASGEEFSIARLPAKLFDSFKEFKRIILISKKPGIEEISRVSIIAAIGILIVGLIGFLIQLVFNFVKL